MNYTTSFHILFIRSGEKGGGTGGKFKESRPDLDKKLPTGGGFLKKGTFLINQIHGAGRGGKLLPTEGRHPLSTEYA